jgi:hypothetical protein
MSEFRKPDEPDWLDSLLRETDEAEPTVEQISRLDASWSQIGRCRQRRQVATGMAGIVMGVATVVLLMVDAPNGSGVRSPAPQATPDIANSLPAHRDNSPTTDLSTDHALDHSVPHTVWDKDELYQRLVASAARRQTHGQLPRRNSSESPHEANDSDGAGDHDATKRGIAEAVKAIADHHDSVPLRNATADRAANQLKSQIDESRLVAATVEQIVQAQLQPLPQVDAAWTLLARLVTPSTVPLLAPLQADPRWSRQANRVMAPLYPSPVLYRIAMQSNEPDVQQAIAAVLLSRGDLVSLRHYLQLVDHPTASQAALVAVDEVATPPVLSLFACLEAPQREIRLTAALVLAQINDARIVMELIKRTQRHATRQPALVALVASDHPLAQEYVQRANRDVHQMAFVHAARNVVNRFSEKS